MVSTDPGNPRNPDNLTSPDSPTSSRHPTEPGRLSELLHITWIMRVAGPHVLAAQQQALPAQTALAARPSTQRLLTEAAAARTPLPDLRRALTGTL